MDEFDFTEDEIREQLEILGYTNVPMERLQEFKRGRSSSWDGQWLDVFVNWKTPLIVSDDNIISWLIENTDRKYTITCYFVHIHHLNTTVITNICIQALGILATGLIHQQTPDFLGPFTTELFGLFATHNWFGSYCYLSTIIWKLNLI